MVKVLKKWTEEEIELLKLNSTKSREELQKLFPDRSIKSVIHKIEGLGLPRQLRHKSYSDEEISILEKNHMKTKSELINLLLDRTWESIRKKLDSLDLERRKGWTYWSEDEEKILLQSKTLEEANEKLVNRSIPMIKDKALKINKKFPNNFWTEDEEYLLKSNYSKLTIPELLIVFPNRTVNSIYQKAHKLELVNYRYRTDITEDLVIKMYIEDGMMIKDICEKLEVSYSVITRMIPYEMKRHRLHLDEIRIIDMYNKEYGSNSIAAQFDTNSSAILSILKRNNIPIRSSDFYYEKYKKELDNDLVVKLYQSEGLSSVEIANKFNVTANTIISRLREKGIVIREDNSFYISGDKNHNWNGGISSELQKERSSKEYVRWRHRVLERDKYECQCCGEKENTLHVHHIENFSSHKEKRYDLDNGIVMCANCHSMTIRGSFHDVYGVYNNNREQLEEYMANYKVYQEKYSLEKEFQQ